MKGFRGVSVIISLAFEAGIRVVLCGASIRLKVWSLKTALRSPERVFTTVTWSLVRRGSILPEEDKSWKWLPSKEMTDPDEAFL